VEEQPDEKEEPVIDVPDDMVTVEPKADESKEITFKSPLDSPKLEPVEEVR